MRQWFTAALLASLIVSTSCFRTSDSPTPQRTPERLAVADFQPGISLEPSFPYSVPATPSATHLSASTSKSTSVQIPTPTVLPPSPLLLASPTPTATLAPTFSGTPALSPSPTHTSTPPPPTLTATATLSPTRTATPVALETSTATPTPTPTEVAGSAPPPTGGPIATPVATASPAPTPTPVPYDGRYGVVLHSRLTSDNQYFLEQLGVNWYLDFQSDMSQVPNGSNKVAYIRVPTDSTVWTSGDAESIEGLSDTEVAALGFLTRSQIRQMAQDSPGTYWYLFGEPNRYGHITGLRFASVFHYFITELTAGDPTAKIVSPSILNWDFTCVGCTGYQTGEGWVQEFIGAYEAKYGAKPPVDVWAIDVYPIDWTNTPNNDPAKPAFYSAKGDAFPHWSIAVQQLQGLRQYLDSIPDYSNTPIWITEIAIHVAYDGWHFGSSGELVPDGSYNWNKMSDYVIRVLDWLDANAATHKIERWFFFITWTDVVNVSSDGYMGITFFNEPGQGATLNCLGETYRHFALGLNPVKCDATGATVPAGPAGQ